MALLTEGGFVVSRVYNMALLAEGRMARRASITCPPDGGGGPPDGGEALLTEAVLSSPESINMALLTEGHWLDVGSISDELR